jgi:tRNA-2-methylthio-N6-dimethylallyladenosine synthase
MNISDSERIAGFLESQNLSPAKDIENSDLIVFNTCGVRQMAEDRVYGQVHNLHKKWNMEYGTKKIVVLTGCLAHRKDVRKRLKDKVDLFFSISDFQSFKNFIIKNYLKITKLKIKNSSDNINCINYLSIKPTYASKHSAFVPIMTGCNNFCSYCVVPYARGREISRPAEEILKEIGDLIKKGCKEIVLLGQNVNSYHGAWNMKNGTKTINFSELLKKIDAIPGNFWLSFVSNHPKDFSEELIETATQLKKVCEYIHLPLQSGNNKILRKMNRNYTQKQYLELIDKIKKSFQKYKKDKLYSITSDIIVGFPGETKKQFFESAKVMKKVIYDMVYFGQFSRRPETAAWKMKNAISKEEKSRREKYLNEILKKTCLDNNKKYVGKIFEIMIDQAKVEPCNQGSTLAYFGRTRTMKNVKIISKNKNLVGKIIKAKIIKANIWNLEACPLKRQSETK